MRFLGDSGFQTGIFTDPTAPDWSVLEDAALRAAGTDPAQVNRQTSFTQTNPLVIDPVRLQPITVDEVTSDLVWGPVNSSSPASPAANRAPLLIAGGILILSLFSLSLLKGHSHA